MRRGKVAVSLFCRGGRRLRSHEGSAFEVFGRRDQGADKTADLELILMDLVPESFVKGALVRAIAHLPAEIETEVRIDHRADEAFFLHCLKRERLHAGALERILLD